MSLSFSWTILRLSQCLYSALSVFSLCFLVFVCVCVCVQSCVVSLICESETQLRHQPPLTGKSRVNHSVDQSRRSRAVFPCVISMSDRVMIFFLLFYPVHYNIFPQTMEDILDYCIWKANSVPSVTVPLDVNFISPGTPLVETNWQTSLCTSGDAFCLGVMIFKILAKGVNNIYLSNYK